MTSPDLAAPVDASRSRDLLEVAVAAANAVGDQLRAAFRSRMDVDFKRDAHDIVTAHDKASERTIIETIMALAPDSAIVGEEGGRIGEGSVEWHVDPIDGTSNFATGLALWCVSIAATVDGAVVAGVIYDPVADHLFSADLSGAYLNGEPMRSAAAAREIGATIVAAYPVAVDLERDGDAALASYARLVRSFFAVRGIGSGALSLAFVAAGWADAAFNIDTNSWDVAAGSFILEQAGGRYTGLDRGEPVNGPGKFLLPDYLAVGAGADYPTLNDVVSATSRNKPVREPGSRSAVE